MHVLCLMGRDSKKSPFPDWTVATPEEVKAWVRIDSECCTAEDFRLDLQSTPGSDWNKSARKVFVDDFLLVGVYACTNRAQISKMFERHFRTIKRQFDRTNEDAEAAAKGEKGDRSEENGEHASEQRRHNVSCLPFDESFLLNTP